MLSLFIMKKKTNNNKSGFREIGIAIKCQEFVTDSRSILVFSSIAVNLLSAMPFIVGSIPLTPTVFTENISAGSTLAVFQMLRLKRPTLGP